MEFLVEFDVKVPDGTPKAEVKKRADAEAIAAAELAREGHILRIWKRPMAAGGSTVLGLYRAQDESQLDALLRALPLSEWMNVTITKLEPHPNDPANAPTTTNEPSRSTGQRLPQPELSLVYRLDATLGPPVDLGETPHGHRRIVPLASGTFTGPALSGTLLPDGSADWQTVRPDGTAEADLRYTLRTDAGVVLYVRAAGIRHGPSDVLARLGRGEDVDPGEYTFRTITRIESSAAELDWLNKGVFISVGARQPAGVTYETYLVG
jgi:muconolactone delta-isomerase